MPNDSKRWTTASRDIQRTKAYAKDLPAQGRLARALKLERRFKHEALSAALANFGLTRLERIS